MGKLTIFWGDKSDDSFYWQLSQDAITGEHSAIPMLESHWILKPDLSCLADLAHKHQVELIVANSDVHFNSVNLPNKAQRHLRKAVPFLLEEQLAEAVDSVFIAVGKRLVNDEIPVRAINHDYLSGLVEAFKAAEIKLDVIRVDLDLIEESSNGYRAVLREAEVMLVGEDGQRWSCEKDLFSWIVQKQLAEKEDEEELPIAIPLAVICENDEQFREFEKELPVGRFAPQAEVVESIEDRLLKEKASVFNLLQGEFEPKAESSPLKNMLLKVATLAGVVLGTYLLYQGTMWFSLSAQSDHLYAEQTTLWKQAFPGRKYTGTPNKKLKSYLKSLGGAGGDSGFLALLKSASDQILDLNQLYPTNISYNSARNELRIDLIAKDLPVLNKYRDDLKQSGHEVDMSSATQRGDGYTSRLTIRR